METQYKMEGASAPALECTKCHALNLDERVARSKADLDSVRMAVAARAASASVREEAMPKIEPDPEV